MADYSFGGNFCFRFGKYKQNLLVNIEIFMLLL